MLKEDNHLVVGAAKSYSKDMIGSNPFARLDPNMGLREFLKVTFLSLSIAPLRVLCLVVLVVGYYLFAHLMLCCKQVTSVEGGLLIQVTRFCTRAVLFVFGFFSIEEHRPVQEPNAERKKKPLIFVANHVSFFEILYFMSTKECPAFVFKKSCAKIPFIGSIASKVFQGIEVDNKNRKKGGAASIIARIEKQTNSSNVEQQRPILVFPEGTTSNGSCLLQFRTGAFVAGVPVQPIVVHYPFRFFSPAYESIYTFPLIWRMLCQFQNRLRVQYLPLYIPNEMEQKNPQLFAENVRREMAKQVKLPLCDAGYKDKLAYHKVLAKRLDAYGVGKLINLCIVNPKVAETDENDEMSFKFYHPDEQMHPRQSV